MSNFRCRPGNLVMQEAVPYGQRWTYHSDHPMAAMLERDYFVSQIGQIRAGDDIRLIRTEGGRVVEVAEVLVALADAGSRSFETHVMRAPEAVAPTTAPAAADAPAPKRALKVKRGYQCYQIVFADDAEKVVGEFGTKAEAEAALPGLMAA